jgi:hypothetical protein
MSSCLVTGCLCCLCLFTIQTVLGCEMRLEVFPIFIQDVFFIPFLECVAIHACVEDERICDVDDLLFSVRLLSRLCISPYVLHLFEQVFNGATGVVSLAHAFIIGHNIDGRDECIALFQMCNECERYFICVSHNGVSSGREELVVESV